MWDRFILIIQTITLLITAYITLFLWRKEQFLTFRKNCIILLEEIKDIEIIVKNLKSNSGKVRSLYFLKDLKSSSWFEKKGEFAKVLLPNEFSVLDRFFSNVDTLSRIQKVLKINFEIHQHELSVFYFKYYLENLINNEEGEKKEKEIKEKAEKILKESKIEPRNPIFVSDKLKIVLDDYREISNEYVFSRISQIINLKLDIFDLKKVFLGIFSVEFQL